MDRRSSRRWPRHLDVRFGRIGEEPQRAVATNISYTGIFIRSTKVMPKGTRLRLEVVHGKKGFVAESVVVRALKTPSSMQMVKPSGMGMRFLTSRELVDGVLPGLPGAGKTKQVVVTTAVESTVAGDAEVQAPVEEAPAATGTSRRSDPPESLVFELTYENLDRFSVAFERDILTGGLFIPTAQPPPLDSIVHVRLGVESIDVDPVVIEARVVHRVEPEPGVEGTNLLVGIGVQFVDPDRAVTVLRSFLG